MNPAKIQQRQSDEAMLNEFLAKWPIADLHTMSLRQYNHTQDKETFCQFVETKTRPLGSIKGNNSTKFGIYKRWNQEKKPARNISNNEYTWNARFDHKNLDEQKAFNSVITEVQQIANFAMAGDFEAIEHLGLNSLFRWKVAFLYSQNRLIPIFAKTELVAIVKRHAMAANYRTPYYEMQKYLMSRKPFDMTVVEYMRELFDEHRGRKTPKLATSKRPRRRRAVNRKNSGNQARRGHEGYTASLFHNEIQQSLFEQLCEQYGEENVFMELNWVDVLVVLPKKIILYEIKCDRYATDCLLNGLGQLMGYAYRAADYHQKEIELVIAGPNDLFENDYGLISFLADQINLPLSYLKIDYHTL